MYLMHGVTYDCTADAEEMEKKRVQMIDLQDMYESRLVHMQVFIIFLLNQYENAFAMLFTFF